MIAMTKLTVTVLESVQSDKNESESDINAEQLDNGSEDEHVEEVQEKKNKKDDIRQVLFYPLSYNKKTKIDRQWCYEAIQALKIKGS